MTFESTAIARTVTGEVRVNELGVTLPHEHLIHRISIHSGRDDNTCVDTDLVADEMRIFAEAGGGTICDVTPVGVGRDPTALREVSEKSGVQVVSAIGIYQAEVWPGELRGESRAGIADFIVREATGETTGIAAGFIGEIASHNEGHSDWRKYQLWEQEVKLFHATADAQRRTGLFVSTHASNGRQGMAQMRAMIEAGGDPERIVIGHCDMHVHEDMELDFDYYHALLAEGASLEFDLFGWDEGMPDSARFPRIAALVDEGHTHRMLLSTDTCRLSQLHSNGGRGLDYLFTTIIPGLRGAGVSEDAIHQMTVANPARLLAIGK